MTTHERLRHFAEERNIRLHIDRGLSIDGLAINELANLLARVTSHAHRSFDNIGAIAHDFHAIDIAIIGELQKPVSHDNDLAAESHANVTQDLKKLRHIVHCIADFFKIAHELKLSPLLEMAALDA